MKLKAKILVKNRKIWWPYNKNDSITKVIQNVLDYTKSSFDIRLAPKLYFEDAEIPANQFMGDHFDDDVSPELELRFDAEPQTAHRVDSDMMLQGRMDILRHYARSDERDSSVEICSVGSEQMEDDEAESRVARAELQEQTDRYLRLMGKDPSRCSDCSSWDSFGMEVDSEYCKNEINGLLNSVSIFPCSVSALKNHFPNGLPGEANDRPAAGADGSLNKERANTPPAFDTSIVSKDLLDELTFSPERNEPKEPKVGLTESRTLPEPELNGTSQAKATAETKGTTETERTTEAKGTTTRNGNITSVAEYIPRIEKGDGLPTSFGSTSRSHLGALTVSISSLKAKESSDDKWKDKLIIRVVECNGKQQAPMGSPDERFSLGR